MLHDALAHFKGEVQAIEANVAMLEVLDDAQRVLVVIEAAPMGAHKFVKLALAGMAEGRMTDVVDQGQRFDKFGIEAQRGSDGTGNLRDFQGVGQAIAKVIGKPRGENLRFRFQAAKGAGMDDAVAVARVFTAVSVRRFREAPPEGSSRVQGPRCIGAKRFGDRNLRKTDRTRANQDCGAIVPRPRSASSAMAVFG